MVFVCTHYAGQEFDPPLTKAIGYSFVLGYVFMLGFAFAFSTCIIFVNKFKTILSWYKSTKVADNIAFEPEFVPCIKKIEPSAQHFDCTPRIATFADDNLKIGRPGPKSSFGHKSFDLQESSDRFNSTPRISMLQMQLFKSEDKRRRNDVVYEYWDTERKESTMEISKKEEKANDIRYLNQSNVPDFKNQHELVKNSATFRNQASKLSSSLGKSITKLLELTDSECLIDEDMERKESTMEEKADDTRFRRQSNIPDFKSQHELVKNSATFRNQVSIFKDISDLSLSESFSTNFQQFSRPNNRVLSQESVSSSIASTIDERIRDSSLGKAITKLLGLPELENLIDEDKKQTKATGKDIVHKEFIVDPVFTSHFAPEEMRCLALVAHNHMKPALKTFVLANKNLLRKFKLTGTDTTMTMLRELFGNDPTIKYGPTCTSGPLGGDAELVAIMCSKNLGGCVFFQDPMSSHPHAADIECLTRQANVHNVLMMPNPATAYACMETMRIALKEGRAEIIPSFFISLSSPSVAEYKTRQNKIVTKMI